MFKDAPNEKGYFEEFGGRFAPEVLMGALDELHRAYCQLRENPVFVAEHQDYLREFAHRPTPLTFAPQLSDHIGGAQIYLKREDLAHTGSWCINNALGQGLLAKHMGKSRLVGATGAGFHGIATAAVARLLDLECTIYIGSLDMQRQAFAPHNIEKLGATLVPDNAQWGKLKEAYSEAVRDWVSNLKTTHNVMASVAGPHPYPMMVRDFHSVIGQEVANQLADKTGTGQLHLVAPVGGGGCALGLFYPFLGSDQVSAVAVEAAGPKNAPEMSAAKLALGSKGAYLGSITLVLQDRHGQVKETQSIAADLDFPVVGPELACHYRQGRISSAVATDEEALSARELIARLENLSISLESAHALAHVIRLAAELSSEHTIIVAISADLESKVAQTQGLDKHG